MYRARAIRLPLCRFSQVGELTDTGDRGATVCDVIEPDSPNSVDLFNDVFTGQPETAAGLDLLKVRPCLGSKGFGELFDVPRAARRIQDTTDMGLLEQKQLGIAGDPPGEVDTDTGISARKIFFGMEMISS